MKYFPTGVTQDKAKEIYKKLSLVFHPDVGGDTVIFQEMLKEYEIIMGKRKPDRPEVKEESPTTDYRYKTKYKTKGKPGSMAGKAKLHLNREITFGKYKGNTVYDIIHKHRDKSYVRFLISIWEGLVDPVVFDYL